MRACSPIQEAQRTFDRMSVVAAICFQRLPIGPPKGIEVRDFNYLFVFVRDFEFWMRGNCRYGHLNIVFDNSDFLNFLQTMNNLNFQVTAATTATAASQELSQSGKSLDPSRAGTKYPVQESLTSTITIFAILVHVGMMSS